MCRGAGAGDVELAVRPGDTGEVDAGVRGVDRPLLAVGGVDRRLGGLLLHEVRHRLAERARDLQERRDRRHHAALLDLVDGRGGDVGLLGELLQGQACLLAQAAHLGPDAVHDPGEFFGHHTSCDHRGRRRPGTTR
jgi:hypothetical protein